MPSSVTTKMLGDAGEHYALSQFTFAGCPSSKMPEGWKGYDLAVETGSGLARVSVKTRSETAGWKTSKWFIFDDRADCDWLVFIFKPSVGTLKSWVIPFDIAKSCANVPTASNKTPHIRDISWAKLNKEPLVLFVENWALKSYQLLLSDASHSFVGSDPLAQLSDADCHT